MWRSRLSLKSRQTAFVLLCSRNISQSSQPVASALNIAIISGSTRTEGPPVPILGQRVNKHFESILSNRGHTVTVIDPKEEDLPLLTKPYFAYAKNRAPIKLERMFETLTNADCYMTITPEYNHAPSPGLLNILNHFGSSTFSFKPSAIVSYSAGQWGGTRAAHSLRPVLSELGCLPVSAMIHIPTAKEVLDSDGKFLGDEEKEIKWNSYVMRCVSQLEWWAEATKEHRSRVDPTLKSPAFKKDPSQRNALK